MSATAHSSLFLGFVVTRADFIESTADEAPTCSRGHRQKGKAKFCAEDGEKFEVRNIETAKPELEKLHEFFGFGYDPDDNAGDNFMDMTTDGEPIRTFQSERYGYPDGKPVLVLGQKVSTVSYYSGSYTTIEDEQLSTVRARVKKLRKHLGMEDRPIQLYHEVELSG